MQNFWITVFIYCYCLLMVIKFLLNFVISFKFRLFKTKKMPFVVILFDNWVSASSILDVVKKLNKWIRNYTWRSWVNWIFVTGYEPGINFRPWQGLYRLGHMIKNTIIQKKTVLIFLRQYSRDLSPKYSSDMKWNKDKIRRNNKSVQTKEVWCSPKYMVPIQTLHQTSGKVSDEEVKEKEKGKRNGVARKDEPCLKRNFLSNNMIAH